MYMEFDDDWVNTSSYYSQTRSVGICDKSMGSKNLHRDV